MLPTMNINMKECFVCLRDLQELGDLSGTIKIETEVVGMHEENPENHATCLIPSSLKSEYRNPSFENNSTENDSITLQVLSNLHLRTYQLTSDEDSSGSHHLKGIDVIGKYKALLNHIRKQEKCFLKINRKLFKKISELFDKTDRVHEINTRTSGKNNRNYNRNYRIRNKFPKASLSLNSCSEPVSSFESDGLCPSLDFTSRSTNISPPFAPPASLAGADADVYINKIFSEDSPHELLGFDAVTYEAVENDGSDICSAWNDLHCKSYDPSNLPSHSRTAFYHLEGESSNMDSSSDDNNSSTENLTYTISSDAENEHSTERSHTSLNGICDQLNNSLSSVMNNCSVSSAQHDHTLIKSLKSKPHLMLYYICAWCPFA